MWLSNRVYTRWLCQVEHHLYWPQFLLCYCFLACRCIVSGWPYRNYIQYLGDIWDLYSLFFYLQQLEIWSQHYLEKGFKPSFFQKSYSVWALQWQHLEWYTECALQHASCSQWWDCTMWIVSPSRPMLHQFLSNLCRPRKRSRDVYWFEIGVYVYSYTFINNLIKQSRVLEKLIVAYCS